MAMINSRLVRMEEKRNIRKVIMFSIGIILVIIGMVTLGIPAIVKMVYVIGERKAGSGSGNDLIPPAPPTINLQWSATNSAVQKISGFAEPQSQVILTLNGKTVGSIKVGTDGGFSFDNVALTSGKNSLLAIAVDQAGNKSQPSAEADMTYSNQQPKLNVNSPTDRQTFSGDSGIDINGSVDPGDSLTINDRVVIVGDDGSFDLKWNLSAGDNTLVFVATDDAGNQTRKELVATFNP